jgi:hypothetical protein
VFTINQESRQSAKDRSYDGDGDGDGFAFLCCLAGFAPGDAAGLADGAAFGAAIVF